MIAIAFTRVADRLLVADPGLVRLKTALRSALACLLTGVVGIGWTINQHTSPTLAAPAILIAMIAPLFLRDARLFAWLTTLLSIWLCASMSFVVAAALAPYPLAGDAGFLVLLCVGILVQACGPRALGSAMVSVVTFYLGLYLHPSEAHVAPMIALSLSAPAMVVLVGRLLVPMWPRATMRLAIHTITLRAERVLAARDARHHDAHLSSLNEAALALEEQLTLLNPPHADALRERLVQVEIAAGQRMYGATSAGDMGTAALREAIAHLEAYGRTDLAKQRPHAHPPVRTLAVRFADMRTKLSWLPALRATTAALLAMLLGHSVSPERWFWAVITTFVVFLGTRSRADTVYRGAQRLAGTFAGALVSALLIVGLRDAPAALVAVMVLSVFGWAYFILNAYAPGVFFITVLVGLVYGQLGFAIGPLVEMRVEEVLVGCLVSFAVAILMMPLSATRHVETRLVAVLVDLRDVVRLAIGTAPSVSGDKPASAMRRLDRSWHDLRIALRPLRTQRVFVWNPNVDLATGSLLACLHWARALGHACERTRTALPPMDAVLRQHGASILAKLDALIAQYKAGDTAFCAPDTNAKGAGSAHVDHPDVAQALTQLDGALTKFAERLGQGVAKPRLQLNWTLAARDA